VLERPLSWKLDRKESTKFSLKYRRGKGEILIVGHDGRGWQDPTSDARGDVFRLVQRLELGFNFGRLRKRLREFEGLPPSFPLRASPAPIPRQTLGRVKARVARLPDVALSRAQTTTSSHGHASVADVLRPVGDTWFGRRRVRGRACPDL
jgi:hypothetical protein